MPGGYSGQLVALDTDQFDLANPLAQAAKIQAAQQDVKANLPQAQADEANARTAGINAALPGVVAESQDKQEQSLLTRAAANNALIADAWSKIDPTSPTATDDMHAAMQSLADQGVTAAKQFLQVPYTQARSNSVVGAFGAKTPQDAAGARASGGLPGDQASPQQVSQWDSQFATLPPKQLQATLSGLDALKAALVRVANSPNPSQAWDQEAAALGHKDWVGQYSALRWQNAWDQTAPLDNYLRGRLTQTGMGVPAPPPPEDVKDVPGEGLVAVRQTPKGLEARTIAAAKPTLVGTDEQGHAVYEGGGGNETVGTHVLGQKPGTYGAGSGGAYNIRYNAYLAVHPGDEQGALEYAKTGAGGAAGHQMGAAQIQLAATTQARADWNAMAQSGAVMPPEGEEAWVQTHAAAYATQLNAAQNDMGSGAGGGGGGGADAATNLRAQLRSDWENSAQAIAAGGPNAAAAHRNAITIERQAATRLDPMPNPGVIPPYAMAQLREGQVMRFPNGTAWTLRGGRAVRLW